MTVPSGSVKKDVGIIVVDIQGDFTTWKDGSLAVEGADKAFVDRVKGVTESLKKKGHPIYATQDWHPIDHVSFFTNHEAGKPFETVEVSGRTQVLWPPHCVQSTGGAEILLDPTLFSAVVRKGKHKDFDSYSGFRDDGGGRTELDHILRKNGIREVIIYGIAFDYCVKATAIDAVRAGYRVTVVAELSPAISPDTATRTAKEMIEAGVILTKRL